MKKRASKKNDRDMLDDYDFSKGVRGKYAKRFAKGSNVIVLPPDLAKAFPTAQAVHDALRNAVRSARNVTNPSPRKRSAKRST